MPIGARVTLRGVKMYEFLDRLVSSALPRVRDFKGVNEKSFDGRGNYTMGITEQIIFPEVDIDKVNKITGMDITFVTTAKTNEEAYELLKELGMPFRNAKKEEDELIVTEFKSIKKNSWPKNQSKPDKEKGKRWLQNMLKNALP